MKRSYCFFLLPILVASAGCPNTDNNVGSLGQDAGAAGSSGQDAGGAAAQPADGGVADSGACGCVVQTGSPDFVQQPLECKCAKGGCPMTIQDMSSRPECANGQTVLGRKGCGKVDTVNNALGGSEFTFDAQTGTLLGVYDYDDVPGGVCNVWVYSYGGPRLSTDCAAIESCAVCGPSSAPPCWTVADAGVPDAAGVGQDAAPVSPEAGAAHQCQLSADGTCSAVTPNTACTPFNGRRYDESAGCYATDLTTLWCCTTAAGDSCGGPAMIGCLQVASAAGTVTYWTPTLAGPSPQLPGAQACDQSESAKVTAAQPCTSTPADSDAEETAIYAVLLGNTGGKLPIIAEQTRTDADGVSNTAQTVASATSGMTGVDPATISSFLAQNATAQSLRADMPLGTPYVLLSPTDPIWNDPNFWTTLRTRYPNGLSIPQGGMGYETFSRVGFNANMDQALVYMGTYAQMIAGTYVSFLEQGYYYLMKKVNGAWTIDQKTQTWTT
jgi:hypothetical protein